MRKKEADADLYKFESVIRAHLVPTAKHKYIHASDAGVSHMLRVFH